MARKGKKARALADGAEMTAVAGSSQPGDRAAQGSRGAAHGDAKRKGATDSLGHEAVDKKKGGRGKGEGGAGARVVASVREEAEEVRDEEGEEDEGTRDSEAGASARAFAHMEAEGGLNDSEAASGEEEGEEDEEEEEEDAEEDAEEEDEEESNEPSCSLTPSLLGATMAYSSGGKPAYVLQLAATADSTRLAAATSACDARLYDCSRAGGCEELRAFRGHEGPVTGVCLREHVGEGSNQSLLTSSEDGFVRVWDPRDPSARPLSLDSGGTELWCVASSRLGPAGTVAAGSESKVFLWDLRSTNVLACFEDVHSEAVTQVLFHPNNPETLFTASVDGLVCSLDATKPPSDDDSLQNVYSVGCSVARIGLFGDSCEGLWCTTHVESLSLWDVDEADRVADFPKARRAASRHCSKKVHYTLSCNSSVRDGGLALLCGRNDGSLFSLDLKPTKGKAREEENVDADVGKKRGRPTLVPRRISHLLCSLEGGHTRVVRDAICSQRVRDVEGTRMWTGGEDGWLCSWSLL